jgi:hypothetical protein
VHAAHPFIAEMAHLDLLSIGSRGHDGSEAALEEDDTISGNIRFDKDIANRKIDWLQIVEQRCEALLRDGLQEPIVNLELVA